MGAVGLTSLVVVLGVLMAACASGGERSSAPHGSARRSAAAGLHTATPLPPASPQAPLSARIVLPYDTMVAGSSMSGQVVVENDTEHELRSSGCLSLFAVGLGNEKISPDRGQPMCLQGFIIPVGESSWPVWVYASFSECGGGVRRCRFGRPPPYPPGDYLAVLITGDRRIPAPSPIRIRVTPRPAVRGDRVWRH
jgi:hypothetical protein